jgi:hypothetical protein
MVLPASSSQATVWDPHVRLQGTASCGSYPNGKVTGLWLWTSQEGGRWFSYSGTAYSVSYSRDFWKVPTSGTSVHYDVYCNGRKSYGTFGLQRPTFGATATRNIWWKY